MDTQIIPQWVEGILNLLAQFTGGRGGIDHVIVNYVIAAMFYGALYLIAQLRLNEGKQTEREKLLKLGFAFAFGREFFMVLMAILSSFNVFNHDLLHVVFPPFEHTLHDLGLVLIAGAFIRFLIKDKNISIKFLRIGTFLTILSYLTTFIWWGNFIYENPTFKFGQVWCDWVHHINRCLVALVASWVIWRNAEGEFKKIVALSFLFNFIAAFLKLPDMYLNEEFENIFTPISRMFYLVSIPMLGYVYLKEQWNESNIAEALLKKAHSKLEETVKIRTQELRSSNEFNSAILKNAPTSIIILKRDFSIAIFNKKTEELLKMSSDEITSRNLSEFIPELKELDTKSIPTNLITTVKNSEGVDTPIDLQLSVINDYDNEFFIGILFDLTEQEKLDKIKSQFMALVSHELRTPITAIIGALGLIRGGAAGEVSKDVSELLDLTSENSSRLSSLIDDILDLEQLESGNMEMSMEPVSIKECLETGYKANLGYAANFDKHLVLEKDPSLDKISIEVDAKRIQQVFSNLISNAVKFSKDNGTVYIRAKSENDRIKISIQDEGIGIPDSELENIFDKFKQVDASTSRSHMGTGLGLPITKELVELMNGDLVVTSEVNKGTIFSISFSICEG
ncbi:MAG: PAS domain S-box-containing protein [Bacteriovoracaceae bacterium]|jgi:PAS domain S-box-containing protein